MNYGGYWISRLKVEVTCPKCTSKRGKWDSDVLLLNVITVSLHQDPEVTAQRGRDGAKHSHR